MASGAVLLDTSLLVDVGRGRLSARSYYGGLAATQRLVSDVSVLELLAGCRSRAAQRALDRQLRSCVVMPVDEATSGQAVALYRRYSLSHNVGILDCFVAATALTLTVPLVTLDQKHFACIEGLDVIRPYVPGSD